MYCTSTITNWWIPFRLLANCFLFFCRDSAVLAELKYPIQNQDRVPVLLSFTPSVENIEMSFSFVPDNDKDGGVVVL